MSRSPRRHVHAHPQSSHLRSRLRSGGRYSEPTGTGAFRHAGPQPTQSTLAYAAAVGTALSRPEVTMPLALPSIFKSQRKLSTTLSTIIVTSSRRSCRQARCQAVECHRNDGNGQRRQPQSSPAECALDAGTTRFMVAAHLAKAAALHGHWSARASMIMAGVEYAKAGTRMGGEPISKGMPSGVAQLSRAAPPRKSRRPCLGHDGK